jgi:hypothetical protein
MEDQELRDRLTALEQKVDAAQRAAEQSRQYLVWLVIGSLAVFVLPLIGLLFAVPAFLSTFDALSQL